MDKIQLQAFSALYGSGQGPTDEEVKQAEAAHAARKAAEETETQHQVRLHLWLLREGIPHFAPFNEGHLLLCRDDIQRERVGRKAKNMGMSPGISDIVVPIARKPHHGLYIELKVQGGRISGAQEWWLKTLLNADYRACVSWSFEESIKTVVDYLALPTWEAPIETRTESKSLGE